MKAWIGLLVWPQGRIGRRSFWLGWLVLTAANMALLQGANAFNYDGFLPLLATLYPTICLYSKRLRDQNLSPWLQVVPRALWVGWLVMMDLLPTGVRDGPEPLGLPWSLLLIACVADAALFAVAALRRTRRPAIDLAETFG